MNNQEISPATMTIKGACHYSGLCPATIYNKINSNELRSTTVGRRRLIIRESLDELLGLREAA